MSHHEKNNQHTSIIPHLYPNPNQIKVKQDFMIIMVLFSTKDGVDSVT